MIKYDPKTQSYHLERKGIKVESYNAPGVVQFAPKSKYTFVPEQQKERKKLFSAKFRSDDSLVY